MDVVVSGAASVPVVDKIGASVTGPVLELVGLGVVVLGPPQGCVVWAL